MSEWLVGDATRENVNFWESSSEDAARCIMRVWKHAIFVITVVSLSCRCIVVLIPVMVLLRRYVYVYLLTYITTFASRRTSSFNGESMRAGSIIILRRLHARAAHFSLSVVRFQSAFDNCHDCACCTKTTALISNCELERFLFSCRWAFKFLH